jgi:AcrR family transcriptional regulator
MCATEPPKLRADARRNRGRILAAARTVFAENGEDAPIHDVARRAGVGVGTVYRHFAHKDVLVGELVKQRFESFADRARRALAQDDAWQAFVDWLRFSSEALARDAATRDALRRRDTVWDRAESSYLDLQEAVDALIDRAQRQGTMRKDLRADELRVLLASGDGSRRHLEILLDGLRAS